jgi:hypothetical protein
VRYELGSYIPEDDFLHSNRRENVKSYIEIYFLVCEQFGLKQTVISTGDINCLYGNILTINRNGRNTLLASKEADLQGNAR